MWTRFANLTINSTLYVVGLIEFTAAFFVLLVYV